MVGEDSTIEPQATVSQEVPTEEIPSSVSDDIQADSREENSNAEIEAETDAEIEADDEVEIRRRHFIIPNMW